MKIIHKLAAVMTVGALMTEVGQAFAGTGGAAGGDGFVEVTKNITTSTSTLPNLITTVAYIGGAGLGVAGIFKMKQHVDNPGQTPMKDSLVRLGGGGALLALPAVMNAMQQTVGDSTKNVGVTKLPAITY